MERNLTDAFSAAGAGGWTAVPYDVLLPHMSQEQQAKAAALCPNPRTVLVAAFPYFAGDRPGNLSPYARGLDYHVVVVDQLNPICDMLRANYPEDTFVPAADNSPLPEKQAAWMGGLGMRGKNGLLILPPYGSYLFLGTILTSALLDVPKRPPAPGCGDCGYCMRACPSGALDQHGVEPERCLSRLSQRKRDLTAEEEAMLARHPYIWGCDICQRVCHHNRDVACTTIPAFTEQLLDSLTLEDLEGLTTRQFQEKYAARAFTWRGPEVLRRNLRLKAPD